MCLRKFRLSTRSKVEGREVIVPQSSGRLRREAHEVVRETLLGTDEESQGGRERGRVEGGSRVKVES